MKRLCMIGALVLCMACAGAFAQEAGYDPYRAVTSLAYDPVLREWTGLSLEERAQYSQEWIPKVEEELNVNPGYRGFHYYETRHVYGVPDESCISEEAAYAVAAAEAERVFMIEDVDWQRVYHNVYFDITQPDAPRWKMYLAVDEIDPWKFIWAEIDAKTGRILKCFERGPMMEYYEFY